MEIILLVLLLEMSKETAMVHQVALELIAGEIISQAPMGLELILLSLEASMNFSPSILTQEWLETLHMEQKLLMEMVWILKIATVFLHQIKNNMLHQELWLQFNKQVLISKLKMGMNTMYKLDHAQN